MRSCSLTLPRKSEGMAAVGGRKDGGENVLPLSKFPHMVIDRLSPLSEIFGSIFISTAVPSAHILVICPQGIYVSIEVMTFQMLSHLRVTMGLQSPSLPLRLGPGPGCTCRP